MRVSYLILLALLGPLTIVAQPNHEKFAPLDLPAPNQFRSASGAPGYAYWQQEASYVIDVRFDTENHRLIGEQTITYTNNSPDDLHFLWLVLEQNKFSPNSRGNAVNPPTGRWRGAFESGGTELNSLELEYQGSKYEPEFDIHDTNLRVDLAQVLKSGGDQIKLHIKWQFVIPEFGADRMGRLKVKEGWIYQLAQWYPKMFVYDDVNGWNVMPYLGQGEFYLEYGDFDVNITLPSDWVVVATGKQLNASETFTEDQLKALQKAESSAETVTIISKRDVGKRRSRPKAEDELTWKFRAENVRDVAFAASPAFILDAASWNGTLMMSAYPQEGIGKGDAYGEMAGWEHSTRYTLHSIKYYSEKWFEYPYPVAINVGGIVGGMEYPMIVFCDYQARGDALFGVTDHEFGHEWFPMMVGSDERRHAWMDEGFNTFINFYSEKAFYGEKSTFVPETMGRMISGMNQSYLAEQPVATYPDNIRRNALGFLAYWKPGYGLVLLREVVLGPKRFDKALEQYVQRWKFKHPQPADFFRTIENVAGEDLDWFWRGWFYTSAQIDQAIADVITKEGQTLILLENRGDLPMPLSVDITFSDGKTDRLNFPVDIWRTESEYQIVVKSDVPATKVKLNPDGWLPDVNQADNVWEEAKSEPAQD